MSSLETQHPESGQLLRYLDGELPAYKARRIRRHAEACWECRSELRELEATMGDCVRYRKSVIQEHTPPPPQPWPDITRQFARVDAQSPDRGLFELFHWPANSRLRWSAAAATAIALVCVLIYQLWRTPPVEAATLLKKAVAAEDIRAPRPRHLRISTSQLQRSTAAIATLFRESDYNWDSPLSARSYQAWRDGLPRKRDEVTITQAAQKPGQDCYRIRTTTDTGALAAATLTLRMADLWPVEGRFEFRNQDWVEVTDVPDETPAAVADTIVPEHRASPLPTAAAPVAAPPANPFPASAPEVSGFGLELRVVAALHRAGADLGDPIEVSRDGERILVTGMGVGPQRQKQIRSALDGLPNVVLRFSEPNLPAPSDQPPATPDNSVDSQSARLQARLETQLGGHAQFERFSSQALDRSDAAMAQAYALRRLAREFSAAKELQLEAKDRGVLHDLGREHATALAREAAELQRTLSAVLASPTGVATERDRAVSETWQAAAEQVFDSTSRVEKLLAVLLGATPADGSTANAPAALATSLAHLQADLDNCQRLLGR